MSEQEIDRLYGLFGSVISAQPAVITCLQCGHSRRIPRRPKRIECEGDSLIVVFEAEKDEGCPICLAQLAKALQKS